MYIYRVGHKYYLLSVSSCLERNGTNIPILNAAPIGVYLWTEYDNIRFVTFIYLEKQLRYYLKIELWKRLVVLEILDW